MVSGPKAGKDLSAYTYHMGCANTAKWVSLVSPFASSSPCWTPSPIPEFPTVRPHTWGDNADGHEQDMLLLVQVQLLQPYLELDEGLNQLQAVSGCKRDGQMLRAELGRHLPKPPHPAPAPAPDGARFSPFSPCCPLRCA